MQVAPTRPLFVTRAKLVNKLTTRAKNFWGRYGTTPKHPSRTRARLATLRSLNWPDNYDELSSPEQTAVRAALDKKFTASRRQFRGPRGQSASRGNPRPNQCWDDYQFYGYPRQGDEAWHRGIGSQPN